MLKRIDLEVGIKIVNALRGALIDEERLSSDDTWPPRFALPPESDGSGVKYIVPKDVALSIVRAQIAEWRKFLVAKGIDENVGGLRDWPTASVEAGATERMVYVP